MNSVAGDDDRPRWKSTESLVQSCHAAKTFAEIENDRMRPSPCHEPIVDVMETLARMIVVARLTDRSSEREESPEQPSPRIDMRSIRS